MNKLMAVFAFAVLLVFLGILAFQVPSPDLIAVAVLVLILAGYDFITSARDPKE